MLLHTHTHLHTRRLLHKDAFTHRHFYTNTFTRRDCYSEAFAHRRFYTQKFLHRETFTHRRFYTQTLLHTDAFTIYTQTLLRTETGTVKSQFYLSFWRSNLISGERVAIGRQTSQFYLEPHFVRKGCDWTPRNRNFTSVFGDRTSCRAKGLRGTS